ncbi:MAG: hypothetical protein Q7S92_01975 [Candidatus Diapherotrites archaeon]|nr:hypothetical protein [Candidatus Diapherotrites archaeon]
MSKQKIDPLGYNTSKELVDGIEQVIQFVREHKVQTIVFPSSQDFWAKYLFKKTWSRKHPKDSLPEIFSLGNSIFRLGTAWTVSADMQADPKRFTQTILNAIKTRYPKQRGRNDLSHLGHTLVLVFEGQSGQMTNFVKQQLRDLKVPRISAIAMYKPDVQDQGAFDQVIYPKRKPIPSERIGKKIPKDDPAYEKRLRSEPKLLEEHLAKRKALFLQKRNIKRTMNRTIRTRFPK